MKESSQIRLFILMLSLVLMSACAFGQQGFDTNLLKTKKQIKQLEKGTIKLDLNITINGKSIDDTLYVLHVWNKTLMFSHDLKVSNKFVIYLDYNSEFELTMSYKGTNVKSIIIDTDAPADHAWYVISGINLTTENQNHIYVGGLHYDKSKDTFVKYLK